MKITLTGAAGNITKPLALKLIEAGHIVTVIGRDIEHLQTLIDKGALVAEGNIEDAAFIHEAFRHADVVYTMIPAPYHLDNWVEYGRNVANNYAKAIQAHSIKKVVNLSTYGAHLTTGKGILQSIAQLEHAFAGLSNTTVIHLRAGFFYSNLFRQIPTIKEFGIFGNNYGQGTNRVPLAHTKDIAAVAFEAITTDNISSNAPYYVVSDVRTLDEIAQVLGTAIQKELTWTGFSDEQLKQALTQSDFPAYLVDNAVEIGHQLAVGASTEHYFQEAKHFPLGKVKLEEFATEFQAAYAHQ